MKALKKIFAMLILTAYLLSMVGCSKKEEKDNRVINVYDNSNGVDVDKSSISIFTNGGNLDTDSITDFKSAIRLIPQKDGYIFAGWYSDESLKNKINAASPTKTQISNGIAYAKWIAVETQTYYIRSDSEVTITDSGRENQQLDIANLSSNYKINDLINSGYKKLKITVTLEVSERDDGYQYIFLYSDSNCASHNISSIMDAFDKYVFGNNEADPSLIYMYKFTHGGDGVKTSWGTVTFTTTIDANRFNDDIYVRYGASGKYDDDWCNRNLVVSVTPIK